jgi:hypothetical protein
VTDRLAAVPPDCAGELATVTGDAAAVIAAIKTLQPIDRAMMRPNPELLLDIYFAIQLWIGSRTINLYGEAGKKRSHVLIKHVK